MSDKEATFRVLNRRTKIEFTITAGSCSHTIVMSWISALQLLRETEMAVRFSETVFDGVIVEMFRREEARRLVKEAKATAKEWRHFADFFGD